MCHIMARQRPQDIIETDKNLGPAIMERSVHKPRCLIDHLLDSKTYKQLTKAEADQTIDSAIAQAIQLCEDFKEELPEAILTYLWRGFKLKLGIAPFRCTAKVHKTPWKTRPIVCILFYWFFFTLLSI